MSTKQLYEKTSEGMKEVSPLVAIEDIYSKLSDTPLEALVSLYNHVKCEWKGSVAETRRTVPLFLRRSGLFITYNNGTKYITEFFSAGTDQITTEGWVKDSNWTPVPDENYISAGVKPGVGTIGYEQLSDNLKQLFREKVSVTNFQDDEDIASVDNMLKLKDREADAANFQSKGYVILRKNLCLINGVVKNILTQDMINQPNIIYEIRYDFDLNEKTLELPKNCTLKFKGGKLKNGKIIANNAIIYSLPTPIFSEIHIKNTFSCEGYIDWFEPKNGYYDYSFSECFRSFSVVNFSKSDYIYTFSGNIIQTDDVKEGRVLKVNKSRLKNLTFLYNIKDDKNPHVSSNSISIYDASFYKDKTDELPVIISGLGVNFYNCHWGNYKYCVGYISTYIDTTICVACSCYLCDYFFVTMNKLGELLTYSFIGDYFGFYKSSICKLSKFPLNHFTVTFSASLPFNLQLSSKAYGTNNTNITLLNCHAENNINRSIPFISDDGTCTKDTIDAVINIIGGFYDIGLIDFTKYNIIHYNNVRFIINYIRTTIDTYKLSIIHNISDIRGSICIGQSDTSFLFIDSENFNPLSNLYSTNISLSYSSCSFVDVGIPELTFDTEDTLEFNCFLSCFEDKISVGDNKLNNKWQNITVNKKGVMLLQIESSLNRSDIKNYYLHVFLIINNVIKRAVIPVYNFRRNNSYSNSRHIILNITKLDVDLFELKPFEGNKSDIKYENLNSGDSRPINVNKGTSFFDNTVNKPIWWTGTKWIDATGADV